MATLDAEDKAFLESLVTKVWSTPLNLTSAGVRRAWILTNPDPIRWPDGKDDGKPILVSPWSILQWTWYQMGFGLDPRVVPYASQVLSRAVWMRPSGLKDAAGADIPLWVLLRDLSATDDQVTALLARPVADVDEVALATALLAQGLGGLTDEDLAKIGEASADELDRRERERLGPEA